MASANDTFEVARSSTAPWDDERRGQTRVPVRQPGTITHKDKPYDCMVLNVSAGGVLMQTDAELQVGEVIHLQVEEWGHYECEVRRHADEGYGLMFLKEIDEGHD